MKNYSIKLPLIELPIVVEQLRQIKFPDKLNYTYKNDAY